MRSLLIVSPHFPPTNGADMHRVRTSLPYYAEFGWLPRVLAVEPDSVEQVWNDPLLLETVPPEVPVRRVAALSARWTRPLGFGAIGLRALRPLGRAGAAWIREQRPDLILFSTTAFPVMTLGRQWRRRFNVPYVLDLQDPWVHDHAPAEAARASGIKHRLMRQLHRCLEPQTMQDAGGLLAVSATYIETLQQRYPKLRSRPCATLRFGASTRDYETAARHARPHGIFAPGDGLWHGVSVGALAPAMGLALRGLFAAFREGLRSAPALFERVRLHFVGTSYAPTNTASKVIEPLAAEFDLGDRVSETPARIPYFAALRVQAEADFIVLPGSEEGGYVPSKLAGCLLARRPLLALLHEQSGGVELLRSTQGGELVTFAPAQDRARPEQFAAAVARAWQSLLVRLPFEPATDLGALEPHGARALTRSQCKLFDEVVSCHAQD